MTSQNHLINLAELEAILENKLEATELSPSHFDYYRGGACDEITLRRNCQAFSELSIWPRMLVDISDRDMSLSLFEQKIDMPIIIAPTAFQALAHSQGELATAAAAKQLNTVMTLSTLSNHSIEEVAQAGHYLWYQLYVYKDRAITKDLVARAEANGYQALVVTVDSPLLGRRERDIRNRFSLPPGLRAANLESFALGNINNDNEASLYGSSLADYIASLYDTGLTWKDLEWIISLTKLPVLVKGILRGDDALKAIAAGAKGIIVSNHGGRQLDTTISTIEALPGITAAIKDKNSEGQVEILLDGGIRRGTDVLKALALGAKAVMIGRPVLWGLALSGESGVLAVLNLLKSEFDLAMALSGCNDLTAITSDLISREK